MPSPNTLKLRSLTSKVSVTIRNPTTNRTYAVNRPKYKVGRVIWSGGTKVGSFKEGIKYTKDNF